MSGKSKKQIVIYDGDCGICDMFRRFVEGLDWFGQFEFQTFQSSALVDSTTSLTKNECEREIKVVSYTRDPNIGAVRRKILGGAAAVAKILQKLPVTFLLGWLMALPLVREICQMVYVWVSTHRHYISSKCGVKVHK